LRVEYYDFSGFLFPTYLFLGLIILSFLDFKSITTIAQTQGKFRAGAYLFPSILILWYDIFVTEVTATIEVLIKLELQKSDVHEDLQNIIIISSDNRD